MLPQISKDGHFIFTPLQGVHEMNHVEHAEGLVYQSHINGRVDTSDYLYQHWLLEWGDIHGQKNNILTWTAVFIPHLMFSLLEYRGWLYR
jgi:hypothetical protein